MKSIWKVEEEEIRIRAEVFGSTYFEIMIERDMIELKKNSLSSESFSIFFFSLNIEVRIVGFEYLISTPSPANPPSPPILTS